MPTFRSTKGYIPILNIYVHSTSLSNDLPTFYYVYFSVYCQLLKIYKIRTKQFSNIPIHSFEDQLDFWDTWSSQDFNFDLFERSNRNFCKPKSVSLWISRHLMYAILLSHHLYLSHSNKILIRTYICAESMKLLFYRIWWVIWNINILEVYIRPHSFTPHMSSKMGCY